MYCKSFECDDELMQGQVEAKSDVEINLTITIIFSEKNVDVPKRNELIKFSGLSVTNKT